VDVAPEALLAIFSETPVDDRFAADIAELRQREAPVDDPWRSE
jgi:hypothetical protein